MAKVAWLGLGVMGYPMAGHLAVRGGHDITVYNRTPAKAAAWVAQYATGRTAATPAEAAKGADVVFACVGNDDDLRAVTTGPEGAFATMKPGSIFVDHTTASADVARELAATAAQRGFTFLDCPVSGGQAGAEGGTLTIMCGGDAQAYAKAEPLMACYAKSVRRIGASGAGQLTKMVNQIAVAGVIQGLAEAIHFAEQAGLDIDAVMATISKGAAQSWQMENRWKTMHARQFDFGFAVDWIRKDLRIVLDEARRNGADLPVTQQLETFYAEVQKMGGNRWDSSGLIARLGKGAQT
ncbi:MAG: NAD(P)-dependent oxidoreductase [Hyphomicrobium sp.]|jgi:3-hydroxyisobutyrate dehydrogenase|nr:NAD(P)-dependent oxidoreductase [Hyphomicrobium sp.]